FTVRFLECAFRNSENHTGVDMNKAMLSWRTEAAETIVDNLVECLDQLHKVPVMWSIVEDAVIRYHVFSENVVFTDIESASAVEVGFARLHNVEKVSKTVRLVAGLSEPLA